MTNIYQYDFEGALPTGVTEVTAGTGTMDTNASGQHESGVGTNIAEFSIPTGASNSGYVSYDLATIASAGSIRGMGATFQMDGITGTDQTNSWPIISFRDGATFICRLIVKKTNAVANRATLHFEYINGSLTKSASIANIDAGALQHLFLGANIVSSTGIVPRVYLDETVIYDPGEITVTTIPTQISTIQLGPTAGVNTNTIDGSFDNSYITDSLDTDWESPIVLSVNNVQPISNLVDLVQVNATTTGLSWSVNYPQIATVNSQGLLTRQSDYGGEVIVSAAKTGLNTKSITIDWAKKETVIQSINADPTQQQLKADVAANRAALEDSANGLAAVKSRTDAVFDEVDDGSYGLAAMSNKVDAAVRSEIILESEVYGPAAIKEAIDDLPSAEDIAAASSGSTSITIVESA